jgi:2-dehydropantoate 2-reductase
LVILATKLNVALDAVKEIQSHLKSNFTLVTLTNGMLEENLVSFMDSKSILSCVISFTAKLLGPAYSGEIFEQPLSKIMFLTLITESVNVSKALNIKLQKLNKLSFYFLSLTEKEVHQFSLKFHLKKFILSLIARKYKRFYASSLYSLKIGRKTEIDFLNGYIVQKGREVNIPTPLHDRIIEIVHKIEKKGYLPSMENYSLIIGKTKEIWGLQ